jgi:hypothetical protein
MIMEIQSAKTSEFIKAWQEGRLTDAKTLLSEFDVNGANGALTDRHGTLSCAEIVR